jgi:hypothetical protein
VKKERREKDVVMEIPLDVVMEKTSLEEKTSLSTQVGPPGPVSWVSPPPTGVIDVTCLLTSRHPHSAANTFENGRGLGEVYDRVNGVPQQDRHRQMSPVQSRWDFYCCLL